MKPRIEEGIKSLLMWAMLIGGFWGICQIPGTPPSPPKPPAPPDPYVLAHGEDPKVAAELFIEHAVRDPDSLVIEDCHSTQTPKGWRTRCTYRAKNGFGGMNREDMWFLTDKGTLKYAGPRAP